MLHAVVAGPSAPKRRAAAQPETPPEPLRITFDGSAAPLEQTDGGVVQAGVTLRPECQGVWRWEQSRTLVFEPKNVWPVGTEFTVTLQREALAPQIILENDKLTFKTDAFAAKLQPGEFYQDPVDPQIKRIVATVQFTYPVDPHTLESRLHMVREGDARRPMRFNVTYDALHFEAYLRSEVIAIPVEDEKINITLDHGVHAAAGGPSSVEEDTREVTVPGRLSRFRIDSTQVVIARDTRYEPEQALVVNCSAGVDEAHLAKAIEAFVLPVNLPAVQGRKHYAWANPSDVGAEVLAASSPLALQPVPADRDFSPQQTFKLAAPPGHYVYVRIKKRSRSLRRLRVGAHFR